MPCQTELQSLNRPRPLLISNYQASARHEVVVPGRGYVSKSVNGADTILWRECNVLDSKGLLVSTELTLGPRRTSDSPSKD